MASPARALLLDDTPLMDDTPCGYCRLPLGRTGLGKMVFDVEHVVPVHHAPELENVVSNLVWACRRCNGRKHGYVYGYDEQWGNILSLFDPRNERWFKHFMGASDGKIHGRSGAGRATVGRLDFNGEPSVLRRRAEGFAEIWWPARAGWLP